MNLSVPNIQTHIDTAVLARMTDPYYRFLGLGLRDNQPEGSNNWIPVDWDLFLEKELYTGARGIPTLVPGRPQQIFEQTPFAVTRSEAKELVEIYSKFTRSDILKQYELRKEIERSYPGDDLRKFLKVLLMEMLINDCNAETIFCFQFPYKFTYGPKREIKLAPKWLGFESLENQLLSLDFTYNLTKNMVKREVARLQGSKDVFEYSRRTFLNWMENEDFTGTKEERYGMNCRPNWSTEVGNATNLSFLAWKLLASTLPNLNREVIENLDPIAFDDLVAISRVDLCYQILRQALILFAERDPKPVVRSTQYVK